MMEENDIIKTEETHSNENDDFNDILASLDILETELSSKTRERRENDSKLISSLETHLNLIDALVRSETSEREKNDADLKSFCIETIDKFKSDILSDLHARTACLDDRYNKFMDELHVLNTQFAAFRESIPEMIENKTSALKNSLVSFQEEFSEFKEQKLERDRQVDESLLKVNEYVTEAVVKESNMREKRYTDLKGEIDLVFREIKVNAKRQQQDFDDRLTSLQADIHSESQERSKADSSIQELLELYVVKIQNTLKASTSSISPDQLSHSLGLSSIDN